MGATAIEPGSATTVSVSMIMHKGMDGPHLFRITIPVKSASGETGELQMLVRANFR